MPRRIAQGDDGRPLPPLLATLVMVLTAACASTHFHAPSSDPQPYLARALAEPQTQAGVTVRMAVLRPDESLAVFGLPLADRGVQPVWLKIENRSANGFRFMPVFLDHDYFSSREVAFLFHSSKADDVAIQKVLTSREMPLYIPAHATVSGYVYTNRSLGLKLVNVELLSHKRVLSFPFARTLPSGELDVGVLDVQKLYPPDRVKTLTLAELRPALEALACCTTNKEGTEPGDPLNLVVVGDEEQLLRTLVRGGWDFTETVNSSTVRSMISSFVFGSPYRNAPISPLYFEGRHQDFAMQRARSSVSQRNHLRLWLTPLRIDGKSVWIGQVSRDIGVRFTTKTPFLTTHAIDPDIDEARDYVLEDMLVTGSLDRWGLVRGVGATNGDSSRTNLTGDHYFTDGLRLVFFVSPTPRAMTDVEVLEWEPLPHK
jgi:hypothetical protein